MRMTIDDPYETFNSLQANPAEQADHARQGKELVLIERRMIGYWQAAKAVKPNRFWQWVLGLLFGGSK
jgi:hypothetical protein